MAHFVAKYRSAYFPAIGSIVQVWYGDWGADPDKSNRGNVLLGSIVGLQLGPKTQKGKRIAAFVFVWVPTRQVVVRVQTCHIVRVVRRRPKRVASYRTVWVRREIALNCGNIMSYAMNPLDKRKQRSIADLLDRPIVLDPSECRTERSVRYVECRIHESWWPQLERLQRDCKELLSRIEQLAHTVCATLPTMLHGRRKGVDLSRCFSYDGRSLPDLVARLGRPARERPIGRSKETVLPKWAEHLYASCKRRST